jgi:TolB-like protein
MPDSESQTRFLQELKRRGVLRMALLYVVAAWLVMQVAEVMIGLAVLPEWVGPSVIAVLAVGFPIALLSSWFYELTPEGVALEKDLARDETLTRATDRRLDFVVIAMLSAAVILFAWDKWWPEEPLEQSIAVLPFENLSGDPGQEYFSDGVSEEILNLLAQFKPLKVIARTSSFSFKGKDVDIATMAEKLNVRHVLEGSVRRSGDRVRITAQLIDAADSTHIWSQTYDRELGDIFAIQDEIAARITESLSLHLDLDAPGFQPPQAIGTASAEAYDAYLKGRELFRRRGGDNIRAAIGEFERALRLDDGFAPAHAQLAIATAFLGLRGDLGLEEITPIAVPHLDRAEALAPNLAEVHAGRALLADVAGEYEAEVRHAQRALEVNPSYGDAMNWMAIALNFLGRYEEHDAVMDQMLTADPVDYVVRYNRAEWLAQLGRIGEARQIADELLAEDPSWGNWAHATLSLFYEGRLAQGMAYALKIPNHQLAGWAMSLVGEYAESRRLAPQDSAWFVDARQGNWDPAVRAVQNPPDHLEQLTLAGGTLVQASRYREALPLLEQAFARAPEGQPIPHVFLGPRPTLWLAEARRRAGDEQGAQYAAEIVRQDLAALRATGRDYSELRLTEAMLEAFDRDVDGVVSMLEKAVDLGLRDRTLHFSGESFAPFRDQPRFRALLQKLDALAEAEHRAILQLVCFHNPAPDEWQPLPETCADVTRAPP